MLKRTLFIKQILGCTAAGLIAASLAVPAAADGMDMSSFDMGDAGSMENLGDMSAMGSTGDMDMSLPSTDMSSMTDGWNDAAAKMSDAQSGQGLDAGAADAWNGMQEKMTEGSLSGAGGGMSFDLSGMSSELQSAALGAGIDLDMSASGLSEKMPEVDISGITKLSMGEADDTLKSMMGDSYTGLDSPLFTANEMPDIDFESLNVDFASMATEMKADGWGDAELVQPTLDTGYAADAKDLFSQQYGDLGLKKGVEEFTIPKTASEMISDTIQTRGKAIADSSYYDSSIYQTALNGVSLAQKVSGTAGEAPQVDTSAAKSGFESFDAQASAQNAANDARHRRAVGERQRENDAKVAKAQSENAAALQDK